MPPPARWPSERRSVQWPCCAWGWPCAGPPDGAADPGHAGQRAGAGRSTGTPVTENLAQPAPGAHGNIVVFRSLLGISWMWFFGAVFLSPVPQLCQGRAARRRACGLACCWWCSRSALRWARWPASWLSRRHVEIGLVPLGRHRHERVRSRSVDLVAAACHAVAAQGVASVSDPARALAGAGRSVHAVRCRPACSACPCMP